MTAVCKTLVCLALLSGSHVLKGADVHTLDVPQALQNYKQIHATHPTNIECLRYLVHLCSDLGWEDDAHEYALRLQRAERRNPDAAASQASTCPRHSLSPAAGCKHCLALERTYAHCLV